MPDVPRKKKPFKKKKKAKKGPIRNEAQEVIKVKKAIPKDE